MDCSIFHLSLPPPSVGLPVSTFLLSLCLSVVVSLVSSFASFYAISQSFPLYPPSSHSILLSVIPLFQSTIRTILPPPPAPIRGYFHTFFRLRCGRTVVDRVVGSRLPSPPLIIPGLELALALALALRPQSKFPVRSPLVRSPPTPPTPSD
ncbi:hypothetical protein BO86DRAFT_111485 [Aspergillus japonicus CBS 114.51]|uniref:Uncharacterized protein n=1 Tax=Aspergillus japonicus CBS 114.51 TaxID=1448312 RepID=A0A8T8XGJ0_ASPJA|nr:hypothetical protein BO86DRAFT_111485 [Aspergillus japonicus CBS 114.51]RAH86489.1 hypothetical protein BO86DRAFT_111485 [Aspergillus japonicus CBS 114.51]